MRRYGGGILYAALSLQMQRGCFRIRTHDQQVTKAQLYRCTRARPLKNFVPHYPEALRYAKVWGRDIVRSLTLADAKRLFPDSNSWLTSHQGTTLPLHQGSPSMINCKIFILNKGLAGCIIIVISNKKRKKA